jgi:hypothetical protein
MKGKWIAIAVIVSIVIIGISIFFVVPMARQKEAIRNCKIRDVSVTLNFSTESEKLPFTPSLSFNLSNPTNVAIILSRIDCRMVNKYGKITAEGSLSGKIIIPPYKVKEVDILLPEVYVDVSSFSLPTDTVICSVYIDTPLGAIKGGEIYG